MKFMSNKNNGQSGFSLVELMIVVGIIGVLATLALPRFKQFQAKAKMAEAMNVLQHVYTLEQSYSLDNNAFVGFLAYGANPATPSGTNSTCGTTTDANRMALGLTIEPCVTGAPTPRFAYNATATASTFSANAFTGDTLNNRVCAGNKQFAISLNESNSALYSANAVVGTTPGAAPIGTVCPN